VVSSYEVRRTSERRLELASSKLRGHGSIRFFSFHVHKYCCEIFLIKLFIVTILSAVFVHSASLLGHISASASKPSFVCIMKSTNYEDYDQKFRQCNCNNKLDLNVKRPPRAWLISTHCFTSRRGSSSEVYDYWILCWREKRLCVSTRWGEGVES
jgi:hypothetical protein